MRSMFIITQLSWSCAIVSVKQIARQINKLIKSIKGQGLGCSNLLHSLAVQQILCIQHYFGILMGNKKTSLNFCKKNRERLCQEYVFYCNEIKNKQAYTGKMQGKLMSIKIKEAMASRFYCIQYSVSWILSQIC